MKCKLFSLHIGSLYVQQTWKMWNICGIILVPWRRVKWSQPRNDSLTLTKIEMAKEKKGPPKSARTRNLAAILVRSQGTHVSGVRVKISSRFMNAISETNGSERKKKKPLTERRLQKMCALKANFWRVVSSQNGMRFVY